jgi:hypothetical protein
MKTTNKAFERTCIFNIIDAKNAIKKLNKKSCDIPEKTKRSIIIQKQSIIKTYTQILTKIQES